ncbi:hypothetical protein KIS1582_5038 [Cytobacillus firmus]|uniref:Large polyvalent protein-associated domain-containing protein n=1 Tax=Cytobacillus firmus TaxID=1399 RepID=A0A800MRP1_CYTFI|nr:LPD16 domain-containing protein [Cytobacillus firmus]KAF0821253.1 hypothetical protein KIS1582_5038 [Cytobacillus firmus]
MSDSTKTLRKSHHQLVGSENDLLSLIYKELDETAAKELVIMAGHFMLFFDEEKRSLTPGIFQEQETELMSQRIKRRVGIFPTYTWDLGVSIGKKYSNQFEDIKYLLLINDWQYVPTQNVSASDLRKDFYETHTQIPSQYLSALVNNGFSSDNILSCKKNSIFFPETWLKYRFQKSASKLVKEGKLEKTVLNDRENQSEISFVDENGNYRTLISCGITGCAGEITEMISEVHKAGHRLLLIFAPGECYQPVQTGVEIALNLYNLSDMKVIVADPGGSGEMSTDEIYEKMVNFTVFTS